MDVVSALRGPLASPGRWLCLLPCLLTVACVTTGGMEARVPTLEEQCNGGRVSACEAWGQQLTVDHRLEEADRAFGLACAMGSTSACMTQGKSRMAQGDLEGAEPPLRKVYEENSEEGALALADLREARGDVAGASRLRWEALGLDKSTVEFALGWRIPWQGGLGGSLDVNVQPMGLGARRLTLGANIAFGSESSLNATVGYQHFLTNWAAPYARVLVGPSLDNRRAPLNVGAEVGFKVFAGSIGHLAAGLGTSFDGSTYTVLQVGMDWIVALMVLAHM
ncbi:MULTISPECIES: hypothetical protein [Corallococcus]|nr:MULTISPECIES: hypothetical protein [Corallococcus]RKH31312.1 hypothetical protein D7X75_19775 [Corallococcus sp. CA031C]